MPPTCITVSEPLKDELERLRDDVFDVDSFDATIRRLVDEPRQGRRDVGDADVLTEPIEVRTSTRELLRYARDNGDYMDYDDVLRFYAGVAERDVGERPVELTPL